MTPAGLPPAGTPTSWAAPRCQRSRASGLGNSDRQSGLGKTRLIAASTKRSAGSHRVRSTCPLKHPELVAQGQNFGAQPGPGLAAHDQGFEHEAEHNVEQGE